MKYKRVKLPNGGVLNYVKNNISKTSMIEIMFNCGSRCDTIPGLAHFTEHMFFTGTDTMTKEEISKKYFDFIYVNAFTNYAQIAFEGNVLTNELEDYVSTVEMLINKSTFTQEAVDKEIPVVQQEIALYKDKYDWISESDNYFNLTKDETAKNEIIGTEASVGSIKSKDVKDYVKKYFIANNMEVYVSSPLSLSKVKSIVVKKLESKLPKNNKFKKLPNYVFKIENANFLSLKHKDIGKSYLYLNFNFDKYAKDHEFVAKFELLTSMINDASEGIAKDLRIEKSLIYSGKFENEFTDDYGLTTFKTECEKGNVNKVVETIAEYIKRKAEQGFSEEELNKAKRKFNYKDESKEPRVKDEMKKLYEYKYFDKIIDKEQIKKWKQQTSLDEINTIFKSVFAVNPRVSLSVFGDIDKKELISKAKFDKLFK